MNLQSTEYADNKGFAEDLTEGKFSFPVVHGVRADMSNRQILSESTRPSVQKSGNGAEIDDSRCAAKEDAVNVAEIAYGGIPQEPHEILRLYPIGAAQPPFSGGSGDQPVGWE